VTFACEFHPQQSTAHEVSTSSEGCTSRSDGSISRSEGSNSRSEASTNSNEGSATADTISGLMAAVLSPHAKRFHLLVGYNEHFGVGPKNGSHNLLSGVPVVVRVASVVVWATMKTWA
jgi:hypothetical protein